MRSITELSVAEARSVEFLLTDVDDTITSDGKLRPAALSALYRLQEAGIRTICVTGGSAGWGDTYLRQWPIEAVVAESGAVCLYRREGLITHYTHPSIDREGYSVRKEALIDAVLSSVSAAKLSSDQFARLYDIAFDHGSEPPYLDSDQIAQVVKVCRGVGASAAVSSIHINAWFGSFDKWEGCRSFFCDVLGLDETALRQQSCYCGDAPNDQVMFSRIPLSFGVGNIIEASAAMEVLPRYVAAERGGEGFARIVDEVLEKRSG
ncbi:MAG: HAD-IIB family hydrolase [Sphaerochaeta sp.]|jgi:HAD superfamily hydrolase (TIGR01484 family)|nr:HAD-IIB family hydrolase [Sphaerochaeta sp.]MDX9915023.1 HAD-IIB family hydrolase [Sphaerochaeta sp.]